MSSPAAVIRTVTGEERLSVPASTRSPVPFGCGSLSPVSSEQSKWLVPDWMMPSAARLSLPRPVPHHAVKDPSREQEEQQHHRAVKIGMGPAGRGFIDAQAGCQQYADRNGHIHIGPAIAQRHRRRREKRAPGIGNNRDRDQRGEPVEQVTGDAGCTGPDADRQQHDVHHPEAGNGKRADQPGGAALFLGERIVGKNLRFKAQGLDLAPQLIVIQLGQMRHGDLFGREIDPRGDYAGFGVEAIFDFRDAAGAADRRDGKAGHQRLR